MNWGVIFTKCHVVNNSYKRRSKYDLWCHFLILSLDLYKCWSASFCTKGVFEWYFSSCFDSWCFCCHAFKQPQECPGYWQIYRGAGKWIWNSLLKRLLCKILRTALVKYGRVTVPWTYVLPKHSINVCDFEFDNQSKLSEIHESIWSVGIDMNVQEELK